MALADPSSSTQQALTVGDGTVRRARGPSLQRAAHGVGIAAELVLAEEYRAQRQNLFPSEGSLQWHLRTKRERLVEAGAVYLINGQLRIHPAKFDRVLLADGRKAMNSRADS